MNSRKIRKTLAAGKTPVALQRLEQEIHDGLAETRAANERTLNEFMAGATSFFDALRPIDKLIAQFQILTVANGGEKTAQAFADCADLLLTALATLQRELKRLAENPFSDINYESIGELGNECQAMRFLADAYVTATTEARPEIQRQMAQALAKAQPIIDRLYKAPRHANPELKIIAEMLYTRREGGMKIKQALDDINRSDPQLYQRFFPHQHNEGKEAYARKLLSRYKAGKV